MRRVRSDISHRIRRRPSIFTAPWFRIALGVGVLLVLALLVGPFVARWFGGDLPRSLSSFVPWGGSSKMAQSRPPDLANPKPSAPAPARAPAPPRPPGTTAAAGPRAAPPAVYKIRVGAFLDHKNADRRMEKL